MPTTAKAARNLFFAALWSAMAPRIGAARAMTSKATAEI